MRDVVILRHGLALTPEEASYWKDLLYRVVKVGTELEVAPPRGCDRPSFEEQVRQALAPSETFDWLGRNGVLRVVPEHCGIEVQVIGRPPHFRELQSQYRVIMNALHSRGARPRATCGLHFHLLTPGLAEPVPEIILANLWNLTRRYAAELKYLTSGGDSRGALCRRKQYNDHQEFVAHAPDLESMAEIQAALRASRAVREHVNFLNLEHLGFTAEGDALPFHLEFRFPDADLSPTSVTSKTFLFLALLLKAVDLSRYGILHVGPAQRWQRRKELLDLLSNNEGDLAASDTRGVDDAMLFELGQGCQELLDFLAPGFAHFEDNAALAVLRELGRNPISLMRCAGEDWPEIEARLAAAGELRRPALDVVDRRLMQRIELGEWSSFLSAEAWRTYAATELDLTETGLNERLARLRAARDFAWDARVGSYVFLD